MALGYKLTQPFIAGSGNVLRGCS